MRRTPFTWRGRELAGAWTNSTHGITDETTVIRISPPLTVPLDLLAAAMPAIAQAVGHRNPDLFRVSEVERAAPFAAANERLRHEWHYLGCRLGRLYDDILGTYFKRQ